MAAVKEDLDTTQELTSVLVVDDEPQVLAAINDTLEGEFRVLTETSPRSAIKLLEREQDLSVIISDQRMPGMNGHEFLAMAREISDATRILITGFSDLEAVIAAINSGRIFAYVSKPWDPAALRIAVLKAAEHYELTGALRDREERFRQLAENIRDVFWIVSADTGEEIYVSPAYEKVFGRSARHLLENPGSWMEAVHEEDRDRASRVLGRTADFEAEYRIRRPDGSIRWIHERGFPVRDSQGRVYRFVGIGEDITDRKIQEEKIGRLSRIRAVLSGINAAIVRTRERQDLFEEACRIAVEEGRFDLAWIGLVNAATMAITPVALRGPASDVELIQSEEFTTRDDVPAGWGTVAQAARTRQPVFCNDLALKTDIGPKLVEFVSRGYHSAMSLPLLSGGSCVAVVVLCARERDVFDAEELQLLSELAADISFALDFMENEEKVNFLAYHDQLTGLANRATLRLRLAQAIDKMKIDGHPFALLLMNINNFRDINNTLGHQNGDILLQEVAKRLREALFESDMVACLGGDEFAILLPRLADKRDIDLVITKIGGSLRQGFTVSSLPINVDVRLGFALYPDHGDSPDLLWRRADVALRAAKELNQTHVFYSPEIDHYDPQRLALIGGLSAAIDANELVLHYQPKVQLPAGRTIGVEALLRWQHPEQGLIYPDSFIPLAERTSLINPLTQWVLADALRQGRSWHRSGLPLEVSVNLSARNLHDPQLGTAILKLARDTRFPLDRLVLEITESAIMVDPARAKVVLAQLNDAGICIAMDDFGIGQSSLNYLKDLPVRNMKIDKSFVMGYKRKRNAAIVRSAIELGHNLGLTVTAEGVEDVETLESLCGLGCDFAQGYYISRPLPADGLVAWMRTSRWKCADA